MEEDGEKSESNDNIVSFVEVRSLDSPEHVKLTPTGRVSHAKSRVYTQRYRKEWEEMPDFKGWLTSVPHEPTRAYCKYCARNLHAHRLSLLKHMCTLKHNRAAMLSNKKKQINKNSTIVKKIERPDNEENETMDNVDNTIYYKEAEVEEEEMVEEVVDAEEEQEEEAINMDYEIDQEVVEESENESENKKCVVKMPRILKQQKQDTLAQALAHVTSDLVADDDDNAQLQMTVETYNDNNDENSKEYHVIDSDKEMSPIKNKIILDNKIQKNLIKSNKVVKSPTVTIEKKNIAPPAITDKKNTVVPTDSSKQLYLFSADGKSYTIVKTLPRLLINQINEKNKNPSAKSAKSTTKDAAVKAMTSLEIMTKNNLSNLKFVGDKQKRPFISTHVIDTSKGIPLSGLQVILYKLNDGKWKFIHESTTSASGSCNDFFKADNKCNLSTGRYKLHYEVEKYYSVRKVATAYPFIEVVFDIKDPQKPHHVPLLLSPYSYSTYRDTLR